MKKFLANFITNKTTDEELADLEKKYTEVEGMIEEYNRINENKIKITMEQIKDIFLEDIEFISVKIQQIYSTLQPVAIYDPNSQDIEFKAKVIQKAIIQYNEVELDSAITFIKDKYSNLVVTEENLKEMSQTRKNLSNLKTKISNTRKRLENDAKIDIEKFIDTTKNLEKTIEDLYNNIFNQEKSFKEKEEEKKIKLATAIRIEILVKMEVDEELHDFIQLDSKVSNKAYTLKKIEDDIKIKANSTLEKYNFIMKEINKNNEGLINKIEFQDIKTIFSSDLTTIISRVETTANMRKSQENKVKIEADEKAKREQEEAIEKAKAEERQKIELENKNNAIEEPKIDVLEKEEAPKKVEPSKRDQNTNIINLTEHECDKLILHEYIDIDDFQYTVVKEEEFLKDKGRWDYPVLYTLERNDGKKFNFSFHRGLTESQENHCSDKYLEEIIEKEQVKRSYIIIQVDGLTEEVTDALLKVIDENKINYEFKER